MMKTVFECFFKMEDLYPSAVSFVPFLYPSAVSLLFFQTLK